MESNHITLHNTLGITSNIWAFMSNLQTYANDVLLKRDQNGVITRKPKQKESQKTKNENIEKNIQNLMSNPTWDIEVYIATQARDRMFGDKLAFSK